MVLGEWFNAPTDRASGADRANQQMITLLFLSLSVFLPPPVNTLSSISDSSFSQHSHLVVVRGFVLDSISFGGSKALPSLHFKEFGFTFMP